MRLSLRQLPILAALIAAFACTPDAGTTSDGATTSTATGTTSNSSGTTDEATTTGATTNDATTTGAPTTGETAGSTTNVSTATGTTGEPVEYCWGFDPDAPAPFLELYSVMQTELGDGVTLPLECGGQGSWMFGLYPQFGGYTPMGDWVTFALTVDVEGYDINPDGHFFSGDVGYSLSCEPVLGGVVGVVPILPPDELADLSVLDGLPAQVHVELDAGGQKVMFDATVSLSAPKELIDLGCGFGLTATPGALLSGR